MVEETGARRKIVWMPAALQNDINRVAQQRGETFSATLRTLARERLEQLDERARVAAGH